MTKARRQSVLVHRVVDGERSRVPDDVVVEEPLSIRLDDTLVATTMRTPGHDFELAAGFCLTEGLLGSGTIRIVRYCGTGSAAETAFNVVSVETGGTAPEPTPRLGPISSSCGWCGSDTISDLAERLPPLPAVAPWDPAVLAEAVRGLGAGQELFAATGGSHAAAEFDRSGRVTVIREDIGRHNAVDKVIGHRVLEGVQPGTDRGLVVSSRASFEIVQKAWAAGYGAVVAVSAASNLAVATARRSGVWLAGFARDGDLVIYAPERPGTAA